MDLKLYNTLSREKEIFKPLHDDHVGLYYCGPTVYWTQHIGNLRGGTCNDLIIRTLKYNGFNPIFIRNYTDVGHLTSDGDAGEDKMEKAAKRDKLTPAEIAEKYIAQYERDTRALNFTEPTVKPRATEHVKEMQEMVQALLDKGFAYATDLAIYFDISKKTDYNKLSKQDIEENLAGAGAGDVSDPNKRHPVDFAIWFFAAGVHKKAIQTWDSPFTSPLVENGRGFPGWHIECSAMNRKYLGLTADIHTGGIEFIPVHHTNEIAQSESASGVRPVNYWLHNNHLLVDSKKMAKSEGTSYSLQEVVEKGFNPLSLRYFFLSAHYRSSQNFTWEALAQAETAYKKLLAYIAEHRDEGAGTVIKEYENEFHEAINDDINMPKALAVAWMMLRDTTQAPKNIVTTLWQFDKVLGLSLDSVPSPAEQAPEELVALLAERNAARENKDWAKADELRAKIESAGYTIKDTDKGPKLFKR